MPNKKTIERFTSVQTKLEQLSPLDVLLEVMHTHYAKWKHPPKDQDSPDKRPIMSAVAESYKCLATKMTFSTTMIPSKMSPQP